MHLLRLRLPEITATIGLPSGYFSPRHDHADLRRLQTRPFRYVRPAPRHARGNPGICGRIRPAADASRRGGRQPLDAQGAVRLGLAPLLRDDAPAVRWLHRPNGLARFAWGE